MFKLKEGFVFLGTFALVMALAAIYMAPAAALETSPAARNFDARLAVLAPAVAMTPAQQQGLAALAAGVEDLAADFDERTGATRGLYNRVGYLSGPQGGDPLAVGLAFVQGNLGALGLTAADFQDFEVTDLVPSKATGATHVYLRQRHAGIPAYLGRLGVHVNREGRVMSVSNGFLPDLAGAAPSAEPAVSAEEALLLAAEHLELRPSVAVETLATPGGAQREAVLRQREISTEDVTAKLFWLPVRAGEARLAWNFQIFTTDEQHVYDMTVDAHTGQVWTRFDWVNDASYRVYPVPVESPVHTTPLPPADARSLIVNPQNGTASPLGWHDTGSTSYQILRGNNVHAYDDRDNNNSPPASQPSCGASLNCDFSINLSGQPSTYVPAAVTNLFYWNNIVHDVQYQYGFDEAGGNFQVNNFGNGGSGNDDVRAEAQDGGGNCNANFLTLPDGSRPRMQMYTCNMASPSRDGDLDNGVIIHEYGHGISIRQVGGPSVTSCLNNLQQAGEGWSDWFALWYTIEPGDAGTDSRGIGNYLFGQAASGPGIRPQVYSTDPALNNYTYESISGLSIPHGVGSVWAQALWEVTWALIDQHGFDSNIYNAAGGSGNQRAMFYVNEGLKITACSPTFTQNRDAIIQVATDNFGGEDVCLLWETFAAYGLGTDAVSGGSNSTNPTNGFSIPEICTGGGGANYVVGSDTFDEIIRTVNVSGFTEPIVVMGPPSFNGSHPSTIRVRNVTSSSFQHNLQEWDYLDGTHTNETIHYLVFERGRSTLGSLDVEAGSVVTDENWATVTFSQAFSTAPVVLAQLASNNGGQAAVTRIRNVSATSFQVRLQEEEANDDNHANETIHWLAIEPGSTTAGGNTFVVGTTGTTVTDAFATINFDQSLSNPAFLAAMQTFAGNNPAALRYRNLGASSVEVKVEEEQSLDSEVGHVAENVGYIAVSR